MKVIPYFLLIFVLRFSCGLPQKKEDHCQLPEHPANGQWKIVQNDTNLKPGDYIAKHTIIEFSCNKGYVLRRKESNFQLCKPDEWMQIKPECLKVCPPAPNTESTTMICTLDYHVVDCLQAPEGARLTHICQKMFHDSNYILNRTCIDGSWSHPLPECQLDKIYN